MVKPLTREIYRPASLEPDDPPPGASPSRWTAGQLLRRLVALAALIFVLIKYHGLHGPSTATSGNIGGVVTHFAPSPNADVAPHHAFIEIDPSKTTDLGWVPSGLPTFAPLEKKNPFAATRSATGPLGKQTGRAFDWGEYSRADLGRFWRTWVGDVDPPPMSHAPLPPHPYPLPESPPPLYPEYYSVPAHRILPNLTFPPDFLLGWATAAQQYEGAIKADGKGPTVWDWQARFPGFVADNTTSDVGDLGYYLYKQDLARMAALGGNAYAFSVFWTRILPFGMAGTPVNEAGLQYYEDLISYCRELGIEPVLTLFHWDTPLAMQIEYGGFASPGAIDDYLHYAEIMFRRYNGTVTKWFTFNEPGVFCNEPGFPLNTTLPGNMTAEGYKWTSRRHVVLAHAKAYHLFKKLKIVGEIAFKSDNYLYILSEAQADHRGTPWRRDDQDDMAAVERHVAYNMGFFAEPIYLTGDWPEIVKADMPPELLPRFSPDEVALIRGTADFFAIDGYREDYVAAHPDGIEACRTNRSDPSWPECTHIKDYTSSPYGWGIGEFAEPSVGWLHNDCSLMRPFLKGLAERYPTEGGIYLTEFGFAEPYETEQAGKLLLTRGSSAHDSRKEYLYQATQDTARTHLFISYLGEMLKAVAEDGIPIKGVFAWSLVDNWEWNSGFKARFGSQFVDYNHPTLKRTFKRSALEISQFWQAHRS